MNRRVTFLFGAGASMPTLPGQAALVDQLRGVNDRRLVPARRYLERFFAELPPEAATFEQVIGPLEIAESNEHWFHLGGRRGGKLLTNRAVLRSFDHWLVRALDPDSLPQYPRPDAVDHSEARAAYLRYYSDPGETQLPYALLLAQLEGSGLLEGTSFVSLNYDLLLDRSLRARGHPLDYSVDAFAEQQTLAGAVSLIKLHGSLNWSICEECHVLRDMGSRTVWPGNDCGDCGATSTRGPLLIRPTVLKDFRNRLWQEMWRTAGHRLRDSSHWVIVGYSLPFADIWILRLLMQSYRSRGDGLAGHQVTIVNPDTVASRRFSGVFRDAEIVESSFESWLRNGGFQRWAADKK